MAEMRPAGVRTLSLYRQYGVAAAAATDGHAFSVRSAAFRGKGHVMPGRFPEKLFLRSCGSQFLIGIEKERNDVEIVVVQRLQNTQNDNASGNAALRISRTGAEHSPLFHAEGARRGLSGRPHRIIMAAQQYSGLSLAAYACNDVAGPLSVTRGFHGFHFGAELFQIIDEKILFPVKPLHILRTGIDIDDGFEKLHIFRNGIPARLMKRLILLPLRSAGGRGQNAIRTAAAILLLLILFLHAWKYPITEGRKAALQKSSILP